MWGFAIISITGATGAAYTVPAGLGVGAHQFSCKVTWNGYDLGTCKSSVTVTKAPLTVTGIEGTTTKTYDGTTSCDGNGLTLKLSGVVGSDDVSVTAAYAYADAGAGTGKTVTASSFTLTGTDADKYYIPASQGSVSAQAGTIDKAPYDGIQTASTSGKYGASKTYDLANLLPDGAALGEVTVSDDNSIFAQAPALVGAALTYKLVNDEQKIGSTANVTVSVTACTNYEPFDLTITVTVTDKEVPDLTIDPITMTYTGDPVPDSSITGAAKVEGTKVTGTWKFDAGQDLTNVSDSGTKTVTFTPADQENYEESQDTVVVTIQPASLAGADVELNKVTFRQGDENCTPSVTNVTLNGKSLGANDYTASIPSATEVGTYTVTITGKGNYTGTATTTFQINFVEQKPLDQTDKNGNKLRLDVETGLSSVPAALSGNSEFDTPLKIENALRTEVKKAMFNAGENIEVFDIRLQYEDNDGTWKDVDANNFPQDGVTTILPYPVGTGATGYTFTVQHLISSGNKAGNMETLRYTPTPDGLECTFTSLSPVAIGYQAVVKPDPTPSGGNGGGGGGGVSTYAVTLEKSEHGKVTSNRVNAACGTTVTLTVTPDSGYVLDTLTVTDSRGNALKLTAKGDGKYTFTMPSRAITVTVRFIKAGTEPVPISSFTDLDNTAWYYGAVNYVLQNGLMSGYGGGLFGPNDPITREQLAIILWKYAGSPAATEKELNFNDAGETDSFALDALRWAVENGILSGFGNGRLGPKEQATRAQVAQILNNFLERR